MKNYQEDLANKPIKKLFWKQSTPAIIGLVVMSLYNVVDTIFIGQSVGTLGVAALAISAPITMIIIGISQALGIGSASIISRALGAKHFNKAGATLGQFFFLSFFLGILMMVFGLLLLNLLLMVFGATETIIPYAREYLSVVLYGAVFLCFMAGANNVIRAEGNAKYAMKLMILSTVINIVLDPILIFGFDMGLKGAAIATVVAQFVSFTMSLRYFLRAKSSIVVTLKDLVPRIKIIGEIFIVGSSSFARQGVASLEQAILNHSLGFYGGDLAIAAFGVIARIIMVLLMPMLGLSQGLQPILGYNYGAKAYKRAKEVLLYAMRIATIFSVVVFFVIMVFSRELVLVFTKDQELLDLSSHAMRIVLFALPIIGFQIIASGVYQSLGKAWKAFIVSIMRQLIFLIPIVLVLPLFYGLDGIFYSFPIADYLSAFVVGILIFFEIRHFDKLLKRDSASL